MQSFSEYFSCFFMYFSNFQYFSPYSWENSSTCFQHCERKVIEILSLIIGLFPNKIVFTLLKAVFHETLYFNCEVPSGAGWAEFLSYTIICIHTSQPKICQRPNLTASPLISVEANLNQQNPQVH